MNLDDFIEQTHQQYVKMVSHDWRDGTTKMGNLNLAKEIFEYIRNHPEEFKDYMPMENNKCQN